jgi:HSP20 family protein
MNLVTWKPFRPLGDLRAVHNRFNRMFDNFPYRETDVDDDSETRANTWFPTTDIYETKDDFVFKMEVPGLAKDDIQVEIKDRNLSVSGERKEEKEVNKEDYHRVESCAGSFYRSFTLPDNIDSKKVNAVMKNGILELRVPKAEEKKPKSIPINFS